MAHEQQLLDELISTLKQHRDEIGLKIHLAKEEAKVEWEKLDEKWNQLTVDYQPLKNAAGETTENLVASLKLVGEEILEGFKRIRKEL